MSFDQSAFEARIDAVGLKYISASELLGRTSSKNKFGTANSKPPMRLWDNIIPTAIIVDAVREHYGKAVKLHSIYRSEAYNQADKDSSKGYTGRAKTSQHMAFSAIDFTVTGVPCTDVEKLLMQWRSEARKFYSPVFFERKAEKVGAGNIPFGELPREFQWWPPGYQFSLAGYIDAYPSENFTHVDTRGVTSKMTE